MRNVPTVYLAGAIEGRTHNEIFKWREYAKWYLQSAKIDVMFPPGLEWQGNEYVMSRKIVNTDLDSIDECQILLANFRHDIPMVGTSSEIFYCWENGYKAFVVIDPNFEKPSAWLIECSDIVFNSMDDALWYLTQVYGYENEERNES